MSEQADRDALAIELHRACPFDNEHIARLVNYETGHRVEACPECFDIADIVNGTDWLVQRDRRVRAEAVEKVTREWQYGGWTALSAPIPAGAIPALAQGQIVTDWLRERADRIEAGA